MLSNEQLAALRAIDAPGRPNKVHLARFLLQLTQPELGKMVGLSQAQISAIELNAYGDTRGPALAAALGCDESDLFPLIVRQQVAS